MSGASILSSVDRSTGNAYSGFVTTKLTAKGHVLIPKAVRQKEKLEAGDDFIVLTTINGDILLRRARRPRKSIVAHMRRLTGLKIERNAERLPRPIEL